MPERRSFSVRPSPRIVRPRVHPSVSLVLFRVPSPSTPARDVSVPSPPARVSCLFAASLAASTSGERFHSLAPVPSSSFHSSSTASSATSSAGLFHPAATSRLHSIQGLLSPCSRPSFRKNRPPCGWRSRADRLAPVATLGRLHFEASVHTEQRSRRNRGDPPRRPLPSLGSLPRARLPTVSLSYSGHPLATLPPRTFALASAHPDRLSSAFCQYGAR